MTLREYLTKKKITLRSFAEAIGVAQYTLQRYLAGTRFPGRAEMKAIHRETKGKVTPNDFYDLKAPR